VRPADPHNCFVWLWRNESKLRKRLGTASRLLLATKSPASDCNTQYYRAPKFAAEHAASICWESNPRAAIFFKHLPLAPHFRSFPRRLQMTIADRARLSARDEGHCR